MQSKSNNMCFYALIAAIMLALIIMVAIGRATEPDGSPSIPTAADNEQTEIVCTDPNGVFCARKYKETCSDPYGIFCSRKAPEKKLLPFD